MKMTIIAVSLIIVLGTGVLTAEENLLRNGGFESITLGELDFWQVDAFRNTDELRRVFTVDSPVRQGERALVIANLAPNDTRVVQWLAVEPDTLYRITCWVMAENVAGGNVGANIAIQGSITPSSDVKDTGDAWKKLELVGRTGPDQTALAVGLRLGFYDNLVTGRAYFDEADAVKLTAAPAGVTIVDFSSNRGTGLLRHRAEDKTARPAAPQVPERLQIIMLAAAAGLLIAALFASLLVTMNRNRKKRAVLEKEAIRVESTQTAVTMQRAHRKSLRVNVTVKKFLGQDNYKLIELRSINISETGMLVSCDDLSLFTVGERLQLAVTYKRIKYDLGAARVIRKQETHQGKGPALRTGFGLAFADTSAAQAKNVRLLLG